VAEQTVVNSSLRGVLTEILQLPVDYVRPANQNAPAGGLEVQFMTVLITNVTGERGHETKAEIPDSPDLMYTIEGMRKATAMVQAFGEGAFDLLLRLNALLDSEWATWQFQQANFGLVVRRGPTDLTALVPALLWQRRALMEIDFYFIVQAQVRVPYFASFSWTIYVDQDGSAHCEVQVQ
jgi:hypothetical protein